MSEAKIRTLLECLHNLNQQSLDEDEGFDTYTSTLENRNNGKPEVFTGLEASSILGNIHTAIRTLEWILGESIAYKYAENEEEAKRYGASSLYHPDGRRVMVPDLSIETFIAGLEGHY